MEQETSAEENFLKAFTDLKLKLADQGDTSGMAVLDKLIQDNIKMHTELLQLKNGAANE